MKYKLMYSDEDGTYIRNADTIEQTVEYANDILQQGYVSVTIRGVKNDEV